MLGGGMRQSGILAAPGMIALTEMSKRLSVDHENARVLAEGLAKEPLVDLDPSGVHSNIVVFKLRPESNFTPATFAIALQAKGVLMVPFVEGTVRAVTHNDVSSADVDAALAAVNDVLQHCPDCDANGNGAAVKSPYGDW